MAADARDLGGPGQRDLEAMALAGSTNFADVVVEIDRFAPGLQRLHVLPGSTAVIESPPEPTEPPEETLRRFLTWGVERFPAERYAVVVWGHGLGWRPAQAGAVTPVQWDPGGTAGGIAFSESRGTVLDTPALARSLSAVSRASLGGRPFDVYASDACLMQSVEVAAELSGAARFVVGSEQIEEDYLGLPYPTWLRLLGSEVTPKIISRCPEDDAACQMAAALPALQEEAAARRSPRPAGYTLSTVDEAALRGELLPALRALGTALDAYLKEDPLRRISLRVLLGGEKRGTAAFRGGSRDLGVFLARLREELGRQSADPRTPTREGVLAAADKVRAALGKAVIAAAGGARYRGWEHEGMAGISVWLPRDADEHRGRKAFFAPSALDRESPRFRGFLEAVFAE
jgi:hypothetical protein